MNLKECHYSEFESEFDRRAEAGEHFTFEEIGDIIANSRIPLMIGVALMLAHNTREKIQNVGI